MEADDASLSGNSASDLRKCIDRSNCPDSRLQNPDGDGNGNVDEREVNLFESNAVGALNVALALGGGEGLAGFGEALRAIVSVDGVAARRAQIERFEIAGAEGSIGSTAAIRISFTLRVEFPGVDDGDTHRVSIARSESGLELADRVVLRAASGWSIREDSILPSNLQAHYGDGQLAGSQGELEGTEPLTFDIERRGGLPGWGWFAIVSSLLLLLGIAILVWSRRRRKV